MSIIVIGGSARLGKEILKIFPNAVAPPSQDLDVTEKEAVADFFKGNKPSVVIHVAAMTNVRLCEQHKEQAWKINVVGTENLVNAILQSKPDAYFIYLSTACIFLGDRGFYKEGDAPYPKNFYALTKLIGEFIVKRLPKHLIIRTNFVAKEKWPYPKAFIDRFGTYLFADDVAKALREILEADLTGVLHLTGDKKLSMYELAKMTTPDVLPMTLGEYYGPPLTIDMTLDTVRWKKYQISNARDSI